MNHLMNKEEEFIMNISKSLARFANDDKSSFDNPFSEPKSKIRVSDMEKLSKSKSKSEDEDDTPKKKKKKKNKYDKMFEKFDEIRENRLKEDGLLFDSILSSYDLDDEDEELKHSLISQGRKYARETRMSKESSEIAKIFSGNEKLVQDIIDGANADIEKLSTDINRMRAVQTGRNNKLISDMCETKKDLYGVVLSAVKESNSMKVKMIEIQSKLAKENALAGAAGDGDALISRAIGSLITAGKGNALGMVGGYAGVSGAKGADEDYVSLSSEDDSDDVYDDESEDEDGRKYLQYEGMGIQYVATQRKDGSMKVTAEDRDGNLVEDYPLPPDADHLNFSINEKLGTATDDYYRKYIFRKE